MPIVLRSAVVDIPVDTLWAILRNFNSHRRWHSAVAESEIEGFHAPDTVGCVRRFTLRNGMRLRERLVALSDRERTLRSGIPASSLPLFDYVAELRLRPVTDAGQTFVTWESRFGTPAGQEREFQALIGEFYEAGLRDLRAFVSKPP